MSSEDSDQDLIEEAVRQFVAARWQGQEPDMDEFLRQYPGLHREIRQSIQDAQRIDVLFDSLVRADEGDFEHTMGGDDLVGQTIGSFQVVEMIGMGGMGVVYLARDTKLGRSVAIKSMPARLVGDSTTRMRFLREARLLASLNHPSIGAIYDIFEQDQDATYLILEYIPGETLAERIAREPLAVEEVLSIGRQVAEAISAAHKAGVIHRDLKPSNIKISPDGGVKVLDFGLAKPSIAEGDRHEITATDPGHVIGTPAYMSPEQARGRDTDHRTDVWSFGCIMYQMLTGHLPFEGETATDTLARIIEREPDWDLLPRSTPNNIRFLLRQCLEKDRAHRLEDIADAAAVIDEAMPASAPTRLSAIPTMSRKTALVVGVLAILALGALVMRFVPQDRVHPSGGEIRLVVLPFENQGPPEDDYHADIVTDAVTSCLDGIRGMDIISRRSAMRYKNRDVGLPQIVEELGVKYILEGTIRREQMSDPDSQITIIAALIRASDDTQVWSFPFENYPNNIRRLQADLAEQVAQVLDITLSEWERQALQPRPAGNAEADLYCVQGDGYMHRSPHQSDLESAIQIYETAAQLDQGLALAYAQLSRAHCKMYWYLYDRSAERLSKAKQALDHATQLDPDLPEVHLAWGEYYYHGLRDYDNALEQFEIVRRHQPDNGDLLPLIGAVQRRQGKYQAAVASMKQAYERDPLSSTLPTEIGTTLVLLGDYLEAKRYYDRAISLAPDVPFAYYFKAWLYLYWQGRTGIAASREVLEQALEKAHGATEPLIVVSLINLDVYEGDYPAALSRLSSWGSESFDTHFFFIPPALLRARICGLMEKHQLEQASYETARVILEAKIRERPRDARLSSSLGVAYAGLRLNAEALEQAQRTIELLSIPEATPDGELPLVDLARIYVMVGKHDPAIDQLESLLYRPGHMSVPMLRLDPVWEPLREHPRFKERVRAGAI